MKAFFRCCYPPADPPRSCDKLSEPAVAFHVKASQRIAIDPPVELSTEPRRKPRTLPLKPSGDYSRQISGT